jgi:hypothetical protein
LGDGEVRDEIRDGQPHRFDQVSSEFVMPITDAIAQKIRDRADAWNQGVYALTLSNCIDFVVSIARIAGLNTPERRQSDTPARYLTELRAANVSQISQ